MEVNLIPEMSNFVTNFIASMILIVIVAKYTYKPIENFLQKKHELDVEASKKIEVADVILEKSKAEQAKMLENSQKEISKQKTAAFEEVNSFKANETKKIKEESKIKKAEINLKTQKELAKINEFVEGEFEKILSDKILEIASKTLTNKDINKINDQLINEL